VPSKGFPRRVKLRTLTLATILYLAPGPAQADAPRQQEIPENTAAAILIEAGRLEDAKLILAHVLQITPNDNEAIFLVGIIAVAEKRYDAAIAAFRRILTAEPDRERVRLELARAFFFEADYDNAERNFRFARAGDLPPETKTVIDQYLAAILRLRRWSYNVGVALADDTNVNGATSVHAVDLYGLPFTLSDNARQKSGSGIAVDLGGEWSPLLWGSTKARFGTAIHRLEYGGHSFDDMTISAYAGPEFLFPRWQVDALITSFRRWYGGELYNEGIGGRGVVSYTLSPKLQLATALDLQTVSYRTATFQNGPIISGNMALSYTNSPSSFSRITVGTASQRANLAAFANNTYWLALDYYRDLPFGFSANLEPAFSWTRYDAPLAAFGVTRSDRAWALRFDVLNRRIEYAGFAPRLSYIYASQHSSIALYRYSRSQIQLGLTRQF
jgi:tetratricopeptide (TPR) repeat protein